MAASRGFEPVYLGPNTESSSALILLSIARECSLCERESLLAGFGSLSRNHEVWVGIPDGHQLMASNVPATVFHQYDELDRALMSYKCAEQAK
jgi:hypothetical protein